MKKCIYLIAAFIFGIIFLNNYIKEDERDIPKIEEPKQYNLSQKEINKLKYVREKGDWKILIIPLAHYEISAKVVNTRPYFFGLDSYVAPQDIGVVWGMLSDENYEKRIDMTTYYSTRTLHYRWKLGILSNDYITTHLANIHIVPKNKEILKKIKRIRQGDEVYLRGYLVKAEGLNTKTNAQYSRVTSLTRNDTGQGACETLYVTDVIYHHKKLFNNKES